MIGIYRLILILDMNKVKQTKSKPKSNKLTFRGILVIVMISFLIIEFGKNAYDNFILKRYGIFTEAVVTKKKHVGAKGAIYTHYEFMTNGKHYQGFSVDDENAEIGDTLEIVFIKSNPKISKTSRFLGIKKTKKHFR